MNEYLIYVNGSLENKTNNRKQAWNWYHRLSAELSANDEVELVDSKTGAVIQSSWDDK